MRIDEEGALNMAGVLSSKRREAELGGRSWRSVRRPSAEGSKGMLKAREQSQRREVNAVSWRGIIAGRSSNARKKCSCERFFSQARGGLLPTRRVGDNGARGAS